MSLYATLDTGRIVRSRSNEDLQAAGWLAWTPGGGWRLTRAGRRYIQRLLEVYTRGDAVRDLAREAAPDPKWARWRREREPVFGDRTGAGGDR